MCTYIIAITTSIIIIRYLPVPVRSIVRRSHGADGCGGAAGMAGMTMLRHDVSRVNGEGRYGGGNVFPKERRRRKERKKNRRKEGIYAANDGGRRGGKENSYIYFAWDIHRTYVYAVYIYACILYGLICIDASPPPPPPPGRRRF